MLKRIRHLGCDTDLFFIVCWDFSKQNTTANNRHDWLYFSHMFPCPILKIFFQNSIIKPGKGTNVWGRDFNSFHCHHPFLNYVCSVLVDTSMHSPLTPVKSSRIFWEGLWCSSRIHHLAVVRNYCKLELYKWILEQPPLLITSFHFRYWMFLVIRSVLDYYSILLNVNVICCFLFSRLWSTLDGRKRADAHSLPPLGEMKS